MKYGSFTVYIISYTLLAQKWYAKAQHPMNFLAPSRSPASCKAVRHIFSSSLFFWRKLDEIGIKLSFLFCFWQVGFQMSCLPHPFPVGAAQYFNDLHGFVVVWFEHDLWYHALISVRSCARTIRTKSASPQAEPLDNDLITRHRSCCFFMT